MPRAARRSSPRREPQPAPDRVAPLSWRRATAILLLLAFAFAGALIAGRVTTGLPQAVWAAGSALLLIAALGLSLPPLLISLRQGWRQRRQRQTGTQVRLTAAGLPFLAALIILTGAAVNSGNNLIYLVVAALLGALVTSGIFSAANLAGLTLDLEWPEQAFANRPAPVRLRLANQKRLLPSYSLRLAATSDAVRGTGGAAGAAPVAAAAAMQAAYFPYLPARRQAGAASEITFPRRGRYTAASFVLSSRFPFGLMDKRRRFRPAAGEQPGPILVVYPQITAAAEAAPAAADATGVAAVLPGAGEDLYRLRPHAPGDSLRRIYWRASAKTGVLQVREFSRELEQRLRVIMALEPGAATAEQLEKAITLCASLLWGAAGGEEWIEFIGANAAPGFATDAGAGGALRAPAPASGPVPGQAWMPPPMPASDAAHAVLRYLALVDCTSPLAAFPASAADGARLFLGHRGQASGVPASARAIFATEL